MNKIKTFYTPKQVCTNMTSSFSKSPLKPMLLMQKIKRTEYNAFFDIIDDFEPINKSDFYLAHTKTYVDNVYKKEGNFNSNSLPWSKELVKSLPYTTGSLLAAKRHAIQNPGELCFAPISGMHHASPGSGSGFCTFSGQVISAIKIYKEFGLSGAYFDLDGHYGNSIDDSYTFNPLLEKAIPRKCNINPKGLNENYINDFILHLDYIEEMILGNKVHYVVFAHGADSHKDDDLGGQLNTECWIKAAEVFAEWVNKVSKKLGKPLPVVLCLFGGYRADDYNMVLELHLKSLLTCNRIINAKEQTILNSN
jgi:acetoin utilization deacetylase AcuC-like enzyme